MFVCKEKILNKQRRNELNRIIDTLEKCSSDIESVLDDEDASRDNMPENLQGSERYEESESASDKMNDAISSINDAVSTLQELI